ncbi:MAG TPA: hypothetical protein PKV96_02895 [Candidatus Saccharimonas sp.]|jgi:hypothetical protein|nr:hypothetical protein [Candidatus Saccharimonas sp.]
MSTLRRIGATLLIAFVTFIGVVAGSTSASAAPANDSTPVTTTTVVRVDKRTYLCSGDAAVTGNQTKRMVVNGQQLNCVSINDSGKDSGDYALKALLAFLVGCVVAGVIITIIEM